MFPKLFTKRAAGAILGALGLTLAIGFSDLMKDVIETTYGSKNDIRAKVLYVFTVFIILLLYSMWLTRNDRNTHHDELNKRYNSQFL